MEQLTLAEQQEYEAKAAALESQKANPLRDLDSASLAELASKDPEFNIPQEFARQPDLHGDPATVQKVADAYHAVRQRGFQASDLPGPKKIVGTVYDVAKGFGKQAWNYAQALVGTPLASAVGQVTGQGPEFQSALGDIGTRQVAENIAGTEQAVTGTAGMAERFGQKLARGTGLAKPLEQYTPEEKQKALFDAVGTARTQQEIATGHGGFMTPVGGEVVKELEEAGKPVRPEEISATAAGDPFSWWAFGKAFHGAGKLVPGAVTQLGERATAAAGDLAAKTAGNVAQAVGGAARGVGSAAEFVAPAAKVVVPIAVAGKAIAKGEMPSLEELLASGLVIKNLEHFGEAARALGSKIGGLGKQVAGETPVTSPYAQLARDTLQAAPGAVGDVARGAAFDIGTAAATAETPQDTEGLGLGTVFGGLGGARRLGGRILSGQLIAPREYGISKPQASSGQFPALDAAHNAAFAVATPGVRARLNAVRQFVRGAAPDTDIFMGGDSASTEQALIQQGVSPEQAKQWASNEGFFSTSMTGADGKQRRVILVNNVDAAPHESFHAIQDVLGEQGNQVIDGLVHRAYASQWDSFGTRYARRLIGGDLGNSTWQERILDLTGKGQNEAKEKISRDIANKLRAQTGAEPAPADVQQLSKAALGDAMDAALSRNSHLTPEEVQRQVWRDVLSPQEAQEAADRYLARELAAENFDAVFKRGLVPQGLPQVLAQKIGNLVSALGGEPLAGRVSQIGRIAPKFAVTEAVRKTAGALAPAVAPKPGAPPAPRPPTVRGPAPLPGSPEARQDNAQQAAEAAAAAPDVPLTAGGTRSPRELLGQIAEAIARGTGIKINYLSAPDEPAAATTSNRDVRRAIIEAYRSMPAAARALWEKSFFPDKVITTKGGEYQVQGWAPEVFASNAHKMAATLNKLGPEGAQLSPYPIDASTGSFTTDGWRQLYEDAQQFVSNQQAGATGAGEPLVVPKEMKAKGFYEPPVKPGVAAPLDQRTADFLNTLFNFKLPETPRMVKGKLPKNIMAQEVSAATLPGRVEIPVRPRGEFTGAEAEKQGIEGRAIAEVNPVRNEIERATAAAGVAMPSMIEAIQKLNLSNIKEVAHAPELPEFRGNDLTLTAGFQPSAEPDTTPADRQAAIDKGIPLQGAAQPPVDAMNWMHNANAEDMRTLREYKGKYVGGPTGWAFDVAQEARTPEDIQALKDAHAYWSPKTGEYMKAGDFDNAQRASLKKQLAREAYEAATGMGLGQANGSVDFIRRHYDPNYQPPMPGEKFSGQAQPRVEAPARLSDEEVRDIPGTAVHRPEPTYAAASAGKDNPWVRSSADPANNAEKSNDNRTLMIQFDTNIQSLGGLITRDEASAYYDKLYSGVRSGYDRMADFWEIPQWMGFAAHSIPDADVYVVRDINQAKQFLNEAKYGNVIFSSMDVNAEAIKELAKDYKGTLDVGGYTDPKTFDSIPNIKWHNSLEDYVKSKGGTYKDGVDYRHFVGSDSIPRLTLSSGCKFKCAFCTIEKTVKPTADDVVNQQTDAIAGLGTKLIYLNDKTFGQASNYKMLSDLNTRVKERNPNFEGFVVQTTASQMVKLPEDWLKKSGIKYVELGIESYNDPILKAVRKPATEGLMDESADKLRRLGITLIPNVLIGLPGETAETYARTLDFLKRNADIISHANIYNLAVYKNTEMAKRITTASPGDYDENVREKTFYADPEVHRVFAGDIYGAGQEMLSKTPETLVRPKTEVGQAQPKAEVTHLRDTDELWPGGFAAIAAQQQRTGQDALPPGEPEPATREQALAPVPVQGQAQPEQERRRRVPGWWLRQGMTEPILGHADFGSEVTKVSSGASDGQTFNSDGTVFAPPPNKKLDVVTLASENVPLSELTPERVRESLAPYSAALSHEDVKPGVFKLAGGKSASIDLNAVVDQAHRENSVAFAKQNDQQAIFDLHKFENVDTGGAGNTVLKTPEQIAAALPDLIAGKPVQFQPKRKITDEFWVAPDGKIISAPDGHYAAAIKHILPKNWTPSTVDDKGKPVDPMGDLYPDVYGKGYVRGVKTDSEIHLDGRPLNKAQREAMENFSFEIRKPLVYAGRRMDIGIEHPGSELFFGFPGHKEGQAQPGNPGDEPGAIKSAAIQDKKTKKIVWTGRYHPGYYDDPRYTGAPVNEGWVTNEGEFLNRRDAYRRAERMGQEPRSERGELHSGDIPDELLGQAQPRRKDEYKMLPAGPGGFSKAWIFPGGAVAQLGGQWHHHFLAEDPVGIAAARKAGITVPPFEGTDESGVRESALQKGFARINLDANNGILTVEARAADWNKIKSQVQKLVESNLDNIDNLRVNLVNRKADDLVDSKVAPLFQMDTDAEKLAAIPFMNEGPRAARVTVTDNPAFRALEEPATPLPPVYAAPKFAAYDKAGALVGANYTKYGDAEDAAGKGGSVRILKQIEGQAQPANETDLFGEKSPLSNSQQGNMTAAELASHFPESVIPRRRDEPISSDIKGSPLYKSAKTEDEAVRKFADKLVQFAEENKNEPGFKSGSKWYSEFVPMLKKNFGADAGIMAELLAATSPQNAPEANYAYALDALQGLRSGRFDKLRTKYEEGLAKLEDGTWKSWARRSGLGDDATPAAFVAGWIDKFDLKPRQSNGQLYGISSVPVLQVITRRWLANTSGPKTQNFVRNLLGTGHEATIDLWADRTMRHAGYADDAERWRILPKNATGVSDADFAFSQKAFAEAAKQLKMKPDALQGALWFAEKQRWARNGWSRLDLGDYRREVPKTEALRAGIEQRLTRTKAVAKIKPTETGELPSLLVEPRNLK